jgi:Putative beta-barrel porin-2, OmpL-like. bbp2
MTRAIRPGFVRAAILSLAAVAGAVPPAAAQTAAPAPEPSPSPTAEAPKVQVTGFVDVYYGYNFNEADPALRTFDVQHNAFSLSLAEVAFAKGVTPESKVGFRVDLDFGKTADLVAAFEPESDGKEIYKHVQQAYASLLTGKVQWDVGKFVTIHGAEVIESQDNWNYTRSVLFGYAIPFYHLGVRATVPVNDKLSVAGLVVNGWNNSSEIYGDVPCLALQVALKPSSKVTWLANYMAGQELPDETADTRHLFDTTLNVAATPKLSVMANFDYGKEGDVSWWGVAGYAKYQVRDDWALVGRYEYLDDTDGGFMTFGTKAQSVTVTSDHSIAGALRARLEYRTDFADEPFFPKDDGSTKKSQTTLTVGVVYSFGGSI